MALKLKEYPKKTKSFKWQFLQSNLDVTRKVQNNEPIYDNFGFNLGDRYGNIVVKAFYDDKPINVKIDVKVKEYKIKKMYVEDDKGRKANEEEILYLVHKDTKFNNDRKVTYQLKMNPNLDYDDIMNLNWDYNINSNSRIQHKGIKKLVKYVKKRDGKFITTILNAGHPKVTEKKVHIKWIDEDFSLDENKFATESKFAKLVELLKKLAEKFGAPITSNEKEHNSTEGGLSFLINFKYENESRNIEDKYSRFVYNELKNKTTTRVGIKGGKEIPIYATPPIDKSFAGVKVKFKLGIYFFLEANALGDIGKTKYTLDFVEQKKKRNKSYWSYDEPANLSLKEL